jgi:hypothetical protein
MIITGRRREELIKKKSEPKEDSAGNEATCWLVLLLFHSSSQCFVTRSSYCIRLSIYQCDLTRCSLIPLVVQAENTFHGNGDFKLTTLFCLLHMGVEEDA